MELHAFRISSFFFIRKAAVYLLVRSVSEHLPVAHRKLSGQVWLDRQVL